MAGADVYVDADRGSDTEHGGTSGEDAYKSLTKAMAGRQSGDVVHAAAGVYRLESETAPDGYLSRVVVPAGVTLVGTGLVENTVIEGEYGMRGVWLEAGATLKGFTVRYGSITNETATATGPYGAGVACWAKEAAKRHKAFVEDCLITSNTNNFQGSGVSCTIVRRSRILNNVALNQGSAAYYGILCDCIVDGNEGGNSTCYMTPLLVNCTFGASNKKRGLAWIAATATNCLFLGEMYDETAKAAKKFTFNHCAFASDASGGTVGETVMGTGSIRVPSARLQVASDYTPVRGSCEAIDAGFNDAVDGETDIYGNNRIYNGTVDMGAVEAGAVLTITASDGGISVTGAQIGSTKLTEEPITVTVTRTFDSHYGCCGFLYNGELVRFGEGSVGESWTRSFSKTDDAPTLVAVYEKVWYVNANIVQEPGKTYDGRSKARAFKTLAAAMTAETVPVSGDEVRVLPGVYDAETIPVAYDNVPARVVVPAGVLLAASGSAEETVIKGGTGVRGVWLEEGATVRGFTIRDANIAQEGAGVAMGYIYSWERNLAFVEDCCITNNTGTRGGGISSVIVRRSRLLCNTGSEHAAAASYGALYDCVIDGHTSLNACTMDTTPIVNCTFGPNNSLRALTKKTGLYVTNTLFMCYFYPFIGQGVSVDHCLFATNNAQGKVTTADPTTLTGTNSRLIDYREACLKDDYSIRARSVAVDAGDSSAAGEKDLFGNPRVAGAAVDIGAAEFQPRGTVILLR